jgi:hypothetical protein
MLSDVWNESTVSIFRAVTLEIGLYSRLDECIPHPQSYFFLPQTTPMSSKWALRFMPYAFLMRHACYMLYISYASWRDDLNIRCRVQIMKIFSSSCSQSLCHSGVASEVLRSRYLNIVGRNANISIGVLTSLEFNVHLSCLISSRNIIIHTSLPLIEIMTTVGIKLLFLIVRLLICNRPKRVTACSCAASAGELNNPAPCGDGDRLPIVWDCYH